MIKYLNLSLVESPVYYCVCFSEDEFLRELKRLKIPKNTYPNWLDDSDARVHFFSNPKKPNKEVAIVCLQLSVDVSIEQHYALLVHEAVHIWQRIRELLGESNPSKEFEAYAIQRLCLELFDRLSEEKLKNV